MLVLAPPRPQLIRSLRTVTTMALARPAVRPWVISPALCLCMLIQSQAKLPPGANRILFVKNLNYTITGEDLYDLFGRYGSIRQIRIGNEQKTRGTAFVVFDDVMDVGVHPRSMITQYKC